MKKFKIYLKGEKVEKFKVKKYDHKFGPAFYEYFNGTGIYVKRAWSGI